MKKLLAIALTITTVLLGTGCLSSAYHFSGQADFPYNPTTDCWNHCVCVWNREPKTELENAMDAYSKLVYPFWIVDFPLEVVVDTAFLPFDAIILCCDDEESEKRK